MTNKPNNICIGQEGSSQQFEESLKSRDHRGDRKSFLAGESAGPGRKGSASIGVAQKSDNGLGQAVWSANGD